MTSTTMVCMRPDSCGNDMPHICLILPSCRLLCPHLRGLRGLEQEDWSRPAVHLFALSVRALPGDLRSVPVPQLNVPFSKAHRDSEINGFDWAITKDRIVVGWAVIIYLEDNTDQIHACLWYNLYIQNWNKHHKYTIPLMRCLCICVVSISLKTF